MKGSSHDVINNITGQILLQLDRAEKESGDGAEETAGAQVDE